MSTQEFRAKYLGKVGATAPKIGTLENAARIYQKGCLDISEREALAITVNSKSISIKNREGTVYVFPIKSTLFCATYKKVPQVVAFNYLCSKDPLTIECHAIYMDSILEAQNFIQAITAAFGSAYKSTFDLDGNSNENDPEDSERKTPLINSYEHRHLCRKNSWIDKINDVFGVFNRKKVY